MKRFLPVAIFLLSLVVVFASPTIIQRYPLGVMPAGIVKVENAHGVYYVTLVKGDSELTVFDASFKPVTIIDLMSNDGVNDIIYRDGKLYCFGFFSGRLVVLDASGYPGRWKKIDEIPTSSRLITGAFLDGVLAILSNENEIIFLDTAKREILKRYDLPVTGLTVVEDGKHFYVSLFHNYNMLTRSMETETGLLVFDRTGKLVKSSNAGKRPSYMLLEGDRLFVVSYAEGSLKVLSKSDLAELNCVTLGRYPNFPVIENGKLWVSVTGENRIVGLDLKTCQPQSYELTGKGPIKALFHKDKIYVLETITGTLEVLDHRGNSIELVKLEGCPVDMAFSENEIAILLQEDWSTGKNIGSLVVMKK